MAWVSELVGPRLARWRWSWRQMEPAHFDTKPTPRRSRLRRHGVKRLGVRSVDPVDDEERHRQDLQAVVVAHQSGCAHPGIDGSGDGEGLAPTLRNVTGMVSGDPEDEPLTESVHGVDDPDRFDGLPREVGYAVRGGDRGNLLHGDRYRTRRHECTSRLRRILVGHGPLSDEGVPRPVLRHRHEGGSPTHFTNMQDRPPPLALAWHRFSKSLAQRWLGATVSPRRDNRRSAEARSLVAARPGCRLG